jgi:hypothetical protein
MQRTNKYGQQVILREVAQAPTVVTRCRQQAASLPTIPKAKRPLVVAEAVALVQAHPQLSAKQAVAFVASRL